jgi:hypothetical protein
MKTKKQLLDENRRLRSSNKRLKRIVKEFCQEQKGKDKQALWQDRARARTKLLYPE